MEPGEDNVHVQPEAGEVDPVEEEVATARDVDGAGELNE